jgi:hypothetical protein
MFLEPFMPEVRHCREIGNPVRGSQARPAATNFRRTMRRGKSDRALWPVSGKPIKPAADSYAIIAAMTAAGVVAGFYSAMAIVRR